MSRPRRRSSSIPKATRACPAHYARAYAYHLGAYPDKANAEADALLATAPDDPFFLELKGQILLEGGQPKEAIAPLRKAVAERARHADDRGDARPRADRVRGRQEFRRGQAGAEDRGQPRQ